MTIKKGLGKKKAIVAAETAETTFPSFRARRLGELLWTLLRQGTDYEMRHFSGYQPVAVANLVKEALAS
jgi:hypothetical protein